MRVALVAVSLACLTLLLFPIRFRPSINPGTYWVFQYVERTFVGGSLVYEYRANWRYRVINTSGSLAFVMMDSNHTIGNRLPDGSWVRGRGEGSTSFIVDVKTRLYPSSLSYSSWWIPSEVRDGDLLPIWNSLLRVTGSAPRLVVFEAARTPPSKLLLDCWALGYQTDLESIAFYYEKTTGFFVYFSFQYRLSADTVVSMERALVSTNLPWPAFSFLQPLLAPVLAGTVVMLILPFIEGAIRGAKGEGLGSPRPWYPEERP